MRASSNAGTVRRVRICGNVFTLFLGLSLDYDVRNECDGMRWQSQRGIRIESGRGMICSGVCLSC